MLKPQTSWHLSPCHSEFFFSEQMLNCWSITGQYFCPHANTCKCCLYHFCPEKEWQIEVWEPVLEKCALASERASRVLQEVPNHMRVASEATLRLSTLSALTISDTRKNTIIYWFLLHIKGSPWSNSATWVNANSGWNFLAWSYSTSFILTVHMKPTCYWIHIYTVEHCSEISAPYTFTMPYICLYSTFNPTYFVNPQMKITIE